jgi:hypothetical protein
MKILLSTALILILTLNCWAQSFEVVETKQVFKGRIGEKIKAQIPIRNLSNEPLHLVVKRLGKVIGTSQKTYFCWDDQCLTTDQEQLPISKHLGSLETTNKFESVLEAGLVPGISSVKYLIYNRDNPSESLVYEVNYTIEETLDRKSLYSSSDIRLNDVYPNPVTEYAIIDYFLINNDVKAKMVFHNVLGSIVSEYELGPFENKLKVNTSDFNSGVYFYTLYIDGDGVVTHKLIVRK